MTFPQIKLCPLMAVACLIGLGTAMSTAARASVVSVAPNASFATTPFSVDLGSGVFTFTAIPTMFIGDPPAGVSTSGSAGVTTLFGGVADFSAGAIIGPGQLYTFAAFAAPTAIPNSAADDFIGLDFTDSTGLHYGYAEVFGTQLVRYGYETAANTAIVTPVPEPVTIAILASGLIGLTFVRRRRPRAAPPRS